MTASPQSGTAEEKLSSSFTALLFELIKRHWAAACNLSTFKISLPPSFHHVAQGFTSIKACPWAIIYRMLYSDRLPEKRSAKALSMVQREREKEKQTWRNQNYNSPAFHLSCFVFFLFLLVLFALFFFQPLRILTSIRNIVWKTHFQAPLFVLYRYRYIFCKLAPQCRKSSELRDGTCSRKLPSCLWAY